MINCCNNLNRGQSASLAGLTEDIITSINVLSSSTIVLPASVNRRLVKLYLMSLSVASAEVWIRYGSSAALTNAAHPLPLRHLLLIDSAQVTNVISAICSSGTAQLRVSAANAS